jgi:hypothetical protein
MSDPGGWRDLKNDVSYCDSGMAVPAIKFHRCRFVDHFPILVKHAHEFARVGISGLAKRRQNVGSNVANGKGRLGRLSIGSGQ